MNYYEDLELDITNSYTKEDIKKQYKVLCKKYHPDNKLTGDSDKFKKLKYAYEHIELDDFINDFISYIGNNKYVVDAFIRAFNDLYYDDNYYLEYLYLNDKLTSYYYLTSNNNYKNKIYNFKLSFDLNIKDYIIKYHITDINKYNIDYINKSNNKEIAKYLLTIYK